MDCKSALHSSTILTIIEVARTKLGTPNYHFIWLLRLWIVIKVRSTYRRKFVKIKVGMYLVATHYCAVTFYY